MQRFVITFYHSALGVFSSKKGVEIQFEFNSSHAERPARTDRFLGWWVSGYTNRWWRWETENITWRFIAVWGHHVTFFTFNGPSPDFFLYFFLFTDNFFYTRWEFFFIDANIFFLFFHVGTQKRSKKGQKWPKKWSKIAKAIFALFRKTPILTRKTPHF